jgi:hypothetical protein
MHFSQIFLLLSAVATGVVAQRSYRPGDYCRNGIWGCGTDGGVPYVGMCDSRNTWAIYDYCNDNRVCESNPGVRPMCVERPQSPESYRPGSRCESGIWGCGTTVDNVPYVGTCNPSSKTWIIYQICNNGRQACYGDSGVRPQCVSVFQKE